MGERIIKQHKLPPMADIPEREKWLWKDKEAIARIERSFKQAEAGELEDVPSRFLEFDEE